MAKVVEKPMSEEPPEERNGNGMPMTGKIPIVMPIFIKK